MVKQLKTKARWLCAVMLLFMGFAESMQAQVASYTFTTTNNTYIPNTARTILSTGNGSSSDDATYLVTLPFTFTFNGTAYNSINVNTNGFITFGATAPTGATYLPISGTTGYAGAVVGYGADVIGIDATSELNWEQVGTSPMSTFVVEFRNVRPYNAAGRVLNFQIRLIEAFGLPTMQGIEIMYGACTGVSTNTTAQVGLRGAGNTDFNNRTTTTDWAASTAGATNTSNMAFNNTVFPASGLTYSWMPPACPAPGGLATSGITTTSANASWTDNGLGGYNWELRASGTCGSGSPLQSGNTAFGTANVALTGLTPSTTYTFCVQSDCGSSFTSTTFTTPCVAVALPYTQDFSGVTVPAIPSCWSVANVNADASTWLSRANSGNNMGTYPYNGTNPGNDWFFTPTFTLTAGTTYRLTYKYGCRSNTFPEALEVKYGLGQVVGNMTNNMATHNPITNTVTGSTGLITNIVNFTPASNGDYSIGFHAISLADQFDLYIDDISVMLAPTCLEPTAVNVTGITTTSADVNWTCVSCTGSYIVEYGPAGFTSGTGTLQNSAASPATVSGLTPNTAYDFYVYQDCGAGDTSIASSPKATITTACTAFTIPFSENFNSTVAPAITNCWKVENTNADNTTWITGPANTGTNVVARYIYNTDALTDADDWMFSPLLTMTGGTSYRLTFKYGARSATFPERLAVAYGSSATSGGMTTTLATIDPIANVASDVNGFLTYSVDFTPASNGDYSIGFHAISDADMWELYFDDVSVNVTPACPDPTVSVANVTGTTADVNWTCSGCTGTFVLEYGPAGFTPGTDATAGVGGTVIVGATSPTNLTGLTPLTGYDVYVRQDCSGSFGPNSAINSFTTGPDCAVAPILSCGTPVTANLTGTGVWSPGSCGFGTPGQEAIYSFTPTQTGNYALQVTAATGGYVDYFIKEASDGCTSTGWLCISDISAPITMYGLPLVAGTEYLILLDAEGTGARSHTFQINCPVANDVPCGAVALTAGANGPFNNTTAGADVGEVAPPGGGCNTRQTWCSGDAVVQNSLWFTFTATSNRMRIVTDNFDSQVAVYSVTNCNDYSTFTLNSANDDGNGGTASADTAYCLTPGNTYYVQVDGYSFAASTAFNITVEDIGLDATFTGASNTCTVGGNQTLTAMAGGVFSGPGVTGTTFNPMTAGVGTHTITYTFPGLDACVTSSQNIDVVAAVTYYQDLDGDTYGNNAVSVQACSAPVGYVTSNTDCDDNNNAVSPAALEVCDGIDNDCDGQTDESTVLWANGVGSTGNEIVNELTVDAMGNSYVVGNFTGTVDFGGTMLTATGTDGFAAKYNNNGTLAWVIKVGVNSEVVGVHLRNADLYISGSHVGTTTLGSYTLTGKGSTDAFIAKLSTSSGNVQWAYNVGSSSQEVAYDITTDESNDVYVVGCFNKTVDFDPGAGTANLVSAGLRDAFIAKYGNDGSFIWAKQFGGSTTDRALNVAYNNNVIYVTGLYQSTTTNEGLSTSGGDDVFVFALDAMGNYTWKKSFGSPTTNDRLGDLVVDASGNLYIGGAYQGACDFDPNAGTVTYPTAGVNYDAFVNSLDNTGAFRWATRMGGGGIDQVYGLTIDGSELFITGSYRGIATFTGTAQTVKSLGILDDIFVANYDLSGNFNWKKSLGGTANDMGSAIAVNGVGEVYLAGTFQGTADFEVASSITTNLTSNGGNDMYVTKVNTCIASASMVADGNDENTENNTFAKGIETVGTSFEVYPNPNNGKFQVKANGIVGNASIQVLDMTGKVVFSEVAVETNGYAETEIMIENATAGIYMVQIQTDAEVKTFKIEIQK